MNNDLPIEVLTKNEQQDVSSASAQEQSADTLEHIHIVQDGSVSTPLGFHSGGLHCGLKRKRKDLGWIYSDAPAIAAGVFTTNLFQAAPLIVTQESLAVEQKLQGILVNSANANACTGKRGLKDAYDMRHSFASKLGVPDHYAAILSTGVIGEFLAMDKLNSGIEQLDATADEADQSFEQAILTTDTSVKHVAVQVEVDGQSIHIGAAAKGSGMIKPKMATMLSFVTTDAAVQPAALQQALRDITNDTFNMITVDGDTSTNDTVLVMANGRANNQALHPGHPQWSVFYKGLEIVCQMMAKQIARDGEGATKLIEVLVKGAPDQHVAKAVSKTIIGSNLVKTAVYGVDPNWGRIVCAVGYSGVELDPNCVSVFLGDVAVVNEGLPVSFDEDQAKAALQEEIVHITVDLNQGQEQAIAWGCDLTYEYIRINASYRT